MAAASYGKPIACASTTARVRSEIAARTASTLGLYVPSSTSTNTGIQPFCTMGFTVVGNDAAVVMTSSPGRNGAFSLWEPSALIAQRFADDPELTSNEYFVPAAAARSRSN